jgi:hypothetical protein
MAGAVTRPTIFLDKLTPTFWWIWPLSTLIIIQIPNQKHLPRGIRPLAGPHSGIPQGEHETNREQ